ncbi:hypothetical protein QBC36DRAFT_370620 [Triangularia setosa]|uniref:AAA+ ATPase lid domain-containing protein n=1 Tax=Triangularia setosa TaxID=2587417 RepID=A0AAN7A383_9PEZI|nr:hypothetical protein QBC36DRAFT_370620 [Podospora setosa]
MRLAAIRNCAEVQNLGSVPTFSLTTICIAQEALDVSYCFEPNINPGAIDTLVMPASRKQMIKALVQKFTSPDAGPATSWSADFIENTGEGHIFCFMAALALERHIGISYQTAECIAEYTNRPLLSLTCGDIGIDEVRMEQQLSKWFRLAEKWGAVMLIDEADVYLERRVVSDLERNSLVLDMCYSPKLFLRCIEYHRGILFLTTNFVGHFDDAFISRIHVVIEYDPLSEDDRRQIWTQFFDKLTDERDDFIVTGRAKHYVLEDDTIKKFEWNDREIRNGWSLQTFLCRRACVRGLTVTAMIAFQIAVALAEFRFLQKTDKSKHDCPTLDQKDFEQVSDMTRPFKEYLHGLQGLDERKAGPTTPELGQGIRTGEWV